MSDVSTFEIEKKFLLTNEQQTALLDGATLVAEKKITDSYWDDAGFSLTLKGNWLRRRDGVFELKAPFAAGAVSKTGVIRFRELTDANEILEELHIPAQGTLEETLDAVGIHPFVTCHTVRKSYKKGEFTIDIDQATYDNSSFAYAVAEVEVLVQSEDETDAAEAKILEFAHKHGLETDQFILGKIAAFIEAEDRRHYDLLIEAGVLK